MASSLVNTYAAISGQLATFSGVGAPPIPGYAIAQAIATGLVGLANVKKIIITGDSHQSIFSFKNCIDLFTELKINEIYEIIFVNDAESISSRYSSYIFKLTKDSRI